MCFIPGFKFPWCAVFFIIIEFLVNAITAFCQFVLSNEFLIRFIDLDIKIQLYFNQLAYILACLFAVIFGSLADSKTGKYPVVISGIFFIFLAPICSLIVNLKGNVITSVRQLFFHLTRAVLACGLTTTGVRMALYIEQSDPFEPSELNNYIVLYWIVTVMPYCIAALVFIFTVKYPIIIFYYNVVVCILSPVLLGFGIAVRMMKMEVEPITRGSITKSVRHLSKVRPSSQSTEPTNKWIPLIGKLSEKHFYLTRRFANLTKLILPVFAVGVSTFICYRCIIEYSEMYDRVNKYKIIWLTITVIFAVELFMLLLARVIILPLLEEIKTEKMLTIGMFALAVPGLILCGLIAVKGSYDPIPKYSRIRVYNCLAGQARLESALFKTVMKIESGGVVVINMRCPPKCSGKIKITNGTDQFEVAIGVKKYISQTYLILPRHFRKLLEEDPFFTEDEQALLPDETAQMFFFSNQPNFVGYIRVLTEIFSINFNESYNNSVVFDVPIGVGSIAVVGNDNKMMLSNRTEYTPRSSYAVFYFYSIKVMVTEMNKDMEAPKVPFILYILIAPAVALASAYMMFLVTLFHLLALECPSSIASFIFSLVYACLNFGPIVWICRGTMSQIGIITVLLAVIVQLLSASLFFWVSASYSTHAVDDEITKAFSKYVKDHLKPKTAKEKRVKRKDKSRGGSSSGLPSTGVPTPSIAE